MQRGGRGDGALARCNLAWLVQPERDHRVAVHARHVPALLCNDSKDAAEVVIEQAGELLCALRPQGGKTFGEARRVNDIEKDDAAINILVAIARHRMAPHYRGGIDIEGPQRGLDDGQGIAGLHRIQNL